MGRDPMIAALAHVLTTLVSVRTLCESNESVGRGGLLKSGAQM